METNVQWFLSTLYRLGWTQGAMARRLGVSHGTITRWRDTENVYAARVPHNVKVVEEVLQKMLAEPIPPRLKGGAPRGSKNIVH